jgi:Na+:H+ antiporter, NhaA family
MNAEPAARRTVLGRLPVPEGAFITDALRQETTGGVLLLVAAVLGLVAANSGLSDAYASLAHWHVGPEALHLHLSLEQWAADGLLAIFFFVAGLELKRELAVGSLRDPAQAVLPVVAAVSGMVVPALVYLAIAWSAAGAAKGWAVPMATDIAFALAVLAVVGSGLPASLRAFLLTLAVVDDLGAIIVIALVYTETIHWLPLLAAGVGMAAYAYLQHRRVTAWWAYIPLAAAVWTLVHASGIHATVAGVALGLLTRVRPDPGEEHSPAEHLEHRIRPLSAAVAVPIFAFFSAGVVVSVSALHSYVDDPAAYGVTIALVLGKLVGVVGGAWLTARLTRATLADDLGWSDVVAVGLLAGIGFTVSLLVAELAFYDQPVRLDLVKTGVLIASLVAAALASLVLRFGSSRRTIDQV